MVEEKCTDVTYKVLCEPRGKPQIIHVDRMRLKKSQTRENEQREERSDARNEEDIEVHEQESEQKPGNTGLSKRSRRPPVWFSDYTADF